MRRMAYHLLAVLILAMTASTIKAQILLVTSGTPSTILLSVVRAAIICRTWRGAGQENGICAYKTGSSVDDFLERQWSAVSGISARSTGVCHSDSEGKKQATGGYCRCGCQWTALWRIWVIGGSFRNAFLYERGCVSR